MGKSKDKKGSREAKEDKKLALGVKRKQLKRKKDRVLECAVDSEPAAGHGVKEEKELPRRKKIPLVKQKKKNKHANVKSNHDTADAVVESLSDSKYDAPLKLKKKSKKKQMESSSPAPAVVYESSIVTEDAGAPKLKKKKRKVKGGKASAGITDAEEILHENQNEETSADVNQLAALSEDVDNEEPQKLKRGKKMEVKKSGKAKKKDKHASRKDNNNLEGHVDVSAANADEIPLVDEDCSRGMKKWILEYKQKRPGLKALQEAIDEFIVAHEEQQEKEKKEREARAAEDGWTVVVHHKGRKKTTDTETGTAVGSVSLAAMQHKMAKMKPKEVDMNFYRFQKREAHLSELAMLQSKFEQDKKRIQELRAQRKFKPY